MRKILLCVFLLNQIVVAWKSQIRQSRWRGGFHNDMKTNKQTRKSRTARSRLNKLLLFKLSAENEYIAKRCRVTRLFLNLCSRYLLYILATEVATIACGQKLC